MRSIADVGSPRGRDAADASITWQETNTGCGARHGCHQPRSSAAVREVKQALGGNTSCQAAKALGDNQHEPVCWHLVQQARSVTEEPIGRTLSAAGSSWDRSAMTSG